MSMCECLTLTHTHNKKAKSRSVFRFLLKVIALVKPMTYIFIIHSNDNNNLLKDIYLALLRFFMLLASL